MSCRQFPTIPNPVQVCQLIYGKQNVNEVRDAVVDSMRRFYGFMCDFDKQNVYAHIQCYLVKILEDAGRNPRAVRLAIPPERLQPNIFPRRYIETNFNKSLAIKIALKDCDEISKTRPQLANVYRQQCFIDYHSI